MRLTSFIVFFLLIHFANSLAATSPRPEIAVTQKSEIVVAAGLPVLIADLGGASFVNPPEFKRVNDIEVLPAMIAGQEMTFSNAEMVRMLKEKVAGDSTISGMNWTYFVPEKVTIKAKNNIFPEGRINLKILSGLQEICESCSFKLKETHLPELKEKKSLIDIELETSGLRVAGGFLIPLRARFAGGSEKTYYVTGQVQTTAKALVANRALQAGEKISAKDLREQEIEITFMQDALATAEDYNSKVLGRMISMGRPLYKSDFRKEVVIQRGQLIRAISGDETFEVSAQMTAEENGAIGDLVKVKNPETQKLMSGKVIEHGVVRIQ